MSRYEHGRILAVNEKQLGSELVAAHVAGVMSLTVEDPVDFDEDGGWLKIADQVIEYSTYDDDTGEITLLSALATDATNSESVWLYDTLYQTVTTELLAEVELDGDDDNTDALECTIAHHLVDMVPEGIRGLRGESVLLEQDGDEWRIVDVLGLAADGATGVKWEADDVYVLTAADVTAGFATCPLSHRPVDESVDARWRRVPQEPTEYTINYDAQTISWPLDGFEKAGDRLWFHYQYVRGLQQATTFEVVTYTSGADNPVSAPDGAAAGDLLLLMIALPSDLAAASNLNGYTLVGQSANVTHDVWNDGTQRTYRLAVYHAAATDGDVPVPTFPANAKDTPWVLAAFRGAGSSVTDSAFSTLGDGAAATTASVGGADIHVFVSLTAGNRIVPQNGATAAENGGSQIDILVVRDAGDSASAGLEANGTPALATAGWCMAALAVGS